MRIRMKRWGAPLLALGLAVTASGCSDILEVENPNNLVEEDLNNPAGAKSIAAGAQATVWRGLGGMLGPYAVATDEAIWIGSRDAWRELDAGNLEDPRNEFTDASFEAWAQARWMADEAVRRLEAFDAEKTLVDRRHLARVYVYAAIAYVTTADMFDDFALSNKMEAAPAIGPANMGTLYDKAIGYLDKALPIAQAVSDKTLQAQVYALRARAKQAKAIWAKVNPVNTASPLVNDAGAVADATQALALAPSADWRYIATLGAQTAVIGESSIAYNVNQRRELQLGPTYVGLSSNLRTITANSALMDPIDNKPSPVVASEVAKFVAGYTYQPITLVSNREMHLIRAEAALAANDMAAFTTHINAVRALDGLTPFSGQVSALTVLKHGRQANLFMQGRRLADLYRFGERSREWLTTSTAVTKPGTFLPITCIELRANPNLSGTC